MTTFNKYGLLLLLFGAVAGAPPRSHQLTDSYTFSDYVSDFERTYEEGSDEWELRQGVFEENLATILEHNHRFYNNEDEDGPTYTMGINEHTDKKPEELYHGYIVGSHRLSLNNEPETSAVSRRLGVSKLPFENEDVSKLPKSVDWREKGVVTPVKSQGGCGSCWAFATTEVVESHVAIETGKLLELSPQELTSCVKNPEHCGGSGGCEGATYELGFDYVAKHGLKLEKEMPYKASDEKCFLEDEDEDEELTLCGSRSSSKSGVASITGYAPVPTNDYVTTMNAVAKTGPVAVAVAASAMSLYEKGVFHHEGTDLNHAVVLVGYGTDEESGEDYWLVRNSWGPNWGEKGYIRIKRENNPSCGTDKKPLDGLACALDADGNKVTPKQMKVCGTLGILYDVSLPVGGYLLQ